jgi:hypothetical protein
MVPNSISFSMRPRTLLLAIAAALSLPVMALGATRNVDKGNAACSDTKGTPFCTVQAAINAATAGDRIEIAAGTYIETLAVDRNLTLAGAGISAVEGTCDGTTNLIGSSAISVSAGVTATLTNVTVKGGAAPFGGGGISNAGVLFVSNSEVCDNLTFALGGGIYDSGALSLDRVQIYGNEAAAAGVEGGGLFVKSGGLALVVNSSFTGNRATQGGAIFIESGGTLVMHRSSLLANFADATIASSLNGRGAGIVNSGLALVDESSIGDNTIIESHGQGGGIYNDGRLILTRSAIYKNLIRPQEPSSLGPSYGAGLYNANTGNATIASSTVTNNRIRPILLGWGAGIANTGTLSLSNVTITKNSNGGAGVSDGAGIYIIGGFGVVSVRNSIIALQANGNDCSLGGVTTDGHNIDSDGTCGLVTPTAGGSDQPNVARPGLKALDDYGGPTLVNNLTDDSPAIDGVPPTECLIGGGVTTIPLTTDQRGNVFVEASGIGSDRSGCDIGAVEFNLIVNGMLTGDEDHDHIPDLWTSANLADGDGLYCFPIGTYAGGCAFGMHGDPSQVKQLVQSLDHKGKSGNGYSLRLRAGGALVTGNPQVRVTFEDLSGGGTKQEFILALPTGNYLAGNHKLDITTTGAYDHITVAIEAGSGGELLVDNASLVPTK